MSYEQKLGKFQIPIDKFISDSMCQYIQNDLEILENVSEEIIRDEFEQELIQRKALSQKLKKLLLQFNK